jgi:hypothetical protein
MGEILPAIPRCKRRQGASKRHFMKRTRASEMEVTAGKTMTELGED